MKKHIGSFQAADDAGNTYTIDEYQDYKTSTYLSGKSETSPGLKEYHCGPSPVSPTGGDRFYIVGLDTEVKKIN